MYGDSVFQWNCFVGCKFSCKYCVPSFQRQMKRQKKRCNLCYTYEPHYHFERLDHDKNHPRLPKTDGDEFIWVASSGDISFADPSFVSGYLIHEFETYFDRTFYLQSKDPKYFQQFKFPSNVILGTTLETNVDEGYGEISKAPRPSLRASDFASINHSRKSITIEPILEFNTEEFTDLIKWIKPERVYVGYDTKKAGLLEPKLQQTKQLIKQLETFTKVKTKLLRERYIYFKCSQCGKLLLFENLHEAKMCCGHLYFIEENKQKTLDQYLTKIR